MPVFEGMNMRVIGGLQSIHDLFPVDEWEKRWSELAAMYELTIPEKE